jgi:hypothetical protein
MATPTLEIPRETWLPYFNELSRLYQGWAVTIEIIAGDLGEHPRADDLPLQGLSYDPAGSQAGDILVEVGDAGMPYETHLIHKPRTVRAAVTNPGAEADLDIESEEGTTTLLRIRRRRELPQPGRADA